MKVLIIGLNWLGDVIMSLQAIQAAATLHSVHILTRPHLAEIYKFALPECKIISFKNFILSQKSLSKLKILRKFHFDHIVVLPDSFRAALTAALMRSSNRTGYSAQNRDFLLTSAISKPKNYKQIHESKLHFNLIKNAGLAETMPEVKQISFSQRKTSAVFSKFNLDTGDPYFLFAPGAAFGSAKRWPPEKFARLALKLQSFFNCKILITCNTNEAEAARIICNNCNNAISLAGKTSLEDLAILVANAKALVTNDSGTMHLGALYNSFTFVPVGPTDMTRTGSLSKNAFYVYSNDKCDLAPCRQKVCPLNHHKCMTGISAQMMFDKIKQRITF
jgi:heptosyltransferase-2